MTSVIFQPMLHDPLGWKPSKTAYTDHYKWRKYGSASKDKLRSNYGQRYQRQLRKQKSTTQRSPLIPNGEQPSNRLIVLNKYADNQEQPKTYRYLPTKTPVFVVEHKQRPATANVESLSCTQVFPRPPTAPPAVQGTPCPTPEIEDQPPVKEKKPVDADNDNSRHWLTFPNPKTPQKIIDIKQRLGQLNVPSTLARPSSASNAFSQKQQIVQPVDRPATASAQHHQQKQPTDDDQHRFLSFDKRETPEDLRATRYRIDKYRYHPSLDNYPPRPQTCPERRNDSSKPITPPELKHNQFSTQPPMPDVWVAEEESKPRLSNNQSSSSDVIQIVNCDNLPNEYADALEISNAAQKAYERNLRMSAGRRPDNLVYRLPAMLPEKKTVSFADYQNPHQSTGMNNPVRQLARTSDNDLGVWIRNATEKERASAMKIVQDVLHPTIMGYDNQSKQVSNRTLSATRKLGRTRTQHQFPCEICERLLIKRHVWDLSGLETLTCPHHPQSIQVRA